MAMVERTFSARLGCRYLQDVPEAIGPRSVLVAALHGFGQNAEDMLKLTRNMVGPLHAIAAIEGPYGFFLGKGTDQVGYGWITSRRAAESIRLHHEMVRHVLEEAGSELAIPAGAAHAGRLFPAGVAQLPFAAAHPNAVRGVVGLCGGLPGDWDDERLPAAYGPRCCTSRGARTSSTRPNARNNTRGVCVFV